MDAWTAIRTRRSTRAYKSVPVPEQTLSQVIEAGRYAPSGGNSQTTHFLVIQDASVLAHLAQLVQKAFAVMEETPGMYRSMAAAIRKAKTPRYLFHYGAPVLIVTANKVEYGNNMADCACALENMMIMANALDLGSCWLNQLRWLNEHPAITDYLRTLGLREDERVYGALALGWPDTDSGLPEREPLARTGNPVTRI